MRKSSLILMLMLSCVAMASQDTLRLYEPATHTYVDTLDARSLLGTDSSDELLFQLLAAQSKRLAAQQDSINNELAQTDLSTLTPFHIGYADSIRIAAMVKERGNTSVMCQPQLFRKHEAPSVLKIDYKHPMDTSALKSSYALSSEYANPVASARNYLTTHAASLYQGFYEKQDDVENGSLRKSLYELSVASKSLIKDSEEESREGLRIIKNKDNPWFKEANLMLQVTQNYVSSNWYEGGNSAFSMYSSVKGTIKYDDKKRVTWENYAEWTAGVSTVAKDSLRKINCSEDLFRLYTKLGVKIVPKLYGSFSAELRTTLFPTFKSNSNNVKTTFLTPLRFNMGLGVDYKPVKGLSIVVSPLAYKLVYANDTIRSPYTSYGIEEGMNLLSDFGTSARVEWSWRPLREISLDSKFYAYTNYRMVELDLEVTCDFIINRFFSARVMLHPRYDSSHKVDDQTKAKMQFKELISVGFAHKFH